MDTGTTQHEMRVQMSEALDGVQKMGIFYVQKYYTHPTNGSGMPMSQHVD